MAGSLPSVMSGALGRPFDQQLAFFRGKLGNLVPTQRWNDIEKAAHDKGFMVAGAQKAELLQDLAMAVDHAMSEGTGIEAFRKDFRAIVERHGWHGWTGEGTARGRAWRTRVIYQTNMGTSYAAGRYAQLQEGGFSLWVYRHNDSVQHPRPQHLAWNGLTLPPDHAFWKTHYPPDGWGCQCYVVGARSNRGAQRLGGQPDKPLPDGWDQIDPKTGAPPGVDKGWDYAPGATVAHDVQVAAQQAAKMDYPLAKAYFENVPAAQRDALSEAYRSLPSVRDDVRRYAQRSLRPSNVASAPDKQTLGLLTSSQAEIVNRLTATNPSGFDFTVDKSTIVAIANRQTRSGSLTAANYGMLPLALNQGVITDAGGGAAGRNAVQVTADIGGATYVATFDVDPGARSLRLRNFGARKP